MLLAMKGISKSFDGVPVLRDVSFDLRAGEIHVLAGENGAGKSTLIKILGGIYPDYAGMIELDEKQARFHSPNEAARAGISIIHQELSLIGQMSVADNVFLGREFSTLGWLHRNAQRKAAETALARLGMTLDVSRAVESFSIATRQMIEIAKALAFDARVLVMDEPTSALSELEVDRLMKLMAELKAQGCGIIYISHKMSEIYRVADRITVLRDGRHVITAEAKALPADDLVRQMVGRELSQQYPRRDSASGSSKRERLRVENLSLRDPDGSPRLAVDGVSFTANAGEILCFAGLQGSGCSEVLNAIFGTYWTPLTGQFALDGKKFFARSPRESVREGIALLTNDRKGNGLVLGMGIAPNVTLPSMPKFSAGGWLLEKKETICAKQHAQDLHIRATSVEQPAASLSGGNQQKVVLAKWLETKPKVFMMDEPTRGVDVGAKHEIYELIHKLRDDGCAILLVTTEMPELLALADRILVMHRGRITAELNGADATQEAVLQAAMGTESKAA